MGTGGGGSLCSAAKASVLLSATLTMAWGLLTVIGMVVPLYVVSGPPAEAVIALLYHRVIYLGHRVELPLLSRSAALLVPVLAVAVLAVMSGAMAAYMATRRPRPPVGSVTVILASSLLAVSSIGPLLGAARVAHAAAEMLASGTRYTVNAGVVDLGRVTVSPGPGLYLVASMPSAALILAAAAAAAAVLADVLAEECRIPVGEGRPSASLGESRSAV